MAKPVYTQPSDRVWQSEMEKKDFESDKQLSTFGDQPQGGDDQTGNYLGTDPVYQNYASPTEAPLVSEKGVQSKIESSAYGDREVGNEGIFDEDEEEEDEDEAPLTPKLPSTPPTPAAPK